MERKRSISNKLRLDGPIWVIFSIFFTLLPAFSAETIQFYDWQVDVKKQDQKKRCYIQFTGATRRKVRLSMHLSIVEEKLPTGGKRTFTLLKISAGRINPRDFSNVTPIDLTDAWVETSSGTSRGKIEKTEIGQAGYFLGGVAGIGLFESLLPGIEKDGITVGYLSEAEPVETIIHTPAPPPHLFKRLFTC